MILTSRFLIFLSLAIFFETISAVRLVKRQSQIPCYNSTGTYLGYCIGGQCIIQAYNLYSCSCPDGINRLDCTKPVSNVVTASPSSSTTCPTACINGINLLNQIL